MLRRLWHGLARLVGNVEDLADSVGEANVEFRRRLGLDEPEPRGEELNDGKKGKPPRRLRLRAA